MHTILWFILWVFLVLTAVNLAWLSERLGTFLHTRWPQRRWTACNRVGWLENRPYHCRRHRWHHGSHASVWYRAPLDGTQFKERVRWYDGELGQISTKEWRRLEQIPESDVVIS